MGERRRGRKKEREKEVRRERSWKRSGEAREGEGGAARDGEVEDAAGILPERGLRVYHVDSISLNSIYVLGFLYSYSPGVRL